MIEARRLHKAEPHKFRVVIPPDKKVHRDDDGRILSAGDNRIPGNTDAAPEEKEEAAA
jgi:hypothetical protein